ncbi:MAG: phosphopyruvate hydratase [Armatimonadetes bacterium]|nr:phosphopyruvate hydratase [Armatimonadota bacterium]MDW8121453.1 phosphopyruvate hydratase [Armatimonadota bacterium]
MGVIEAVTALEILDSRGNPTVQVHLRLDNGIEVWSAVPSGASTGEKEALELRDGDPKRFGGKGVLSAVHNVNTVIAETVRGLNPANQSALDRALIRLDGTKNKSRLGANSLLGVSLAAARAAAVDRGVPLYRHIADLFGSKGVTLPVPMMNVLNGGAHAPNNLDIQEFMIVPAGAHTFADALRMGTEVYHTLRKVLATLGRLSGIGDEGGFAPVLDGGSSEALALLAESVEKAGYQLGKDIFLALDCAASELWDHKKRIYVWQREGKRMNSQEMISFYEELMERFPIISIEDGLSERDWNGWEILTKTLGHKVQLVGDDLFVTNKQILKKGIQRHIANAILIKVNQIGTLWETLETMRLAQSAGYSCIISHRSGETEDTFIADLAVGTDAGQIKTGAPARSERVAKYNRLLQIEVTLGENAHFPGLKTFTGAAGKEKP